MLVRRDLRSSRILVEMISREADSSGFAEIGQEAQTVLAKIRAQSGDRTAASKQLHLLEARERNAGLLLRAKKTNAVHAMVTNAENPSCVNR